MEYTVTIDNFEGPLDLLLHLLKDSKINIVDISISEITSQYLSYLDLMESFHLNVASEYLVMAAELIELKSNTLIPKKNLEETDEYEENTRENLINRLLEYEKYKQISVGLQELEDERIHLYTKQSTPIENIITMEKEINDDVGIDDLVLALNKMLERKNIKKPLNTKVTRKEYSIKDRVNDIKKILETKEKINFEDLFDKFTKDYIVITFLAILTLAKQKGIKINQEKNYTDIIITRG